MAAIFPVLLLAACAHGNDSQASFVNYGDFMASKYTDALPSTLVPPSARDIAITLDSDGTDIDAKFAFAAADAERVIAPFRSPDQIRLHELERSGALPPSRPGNALFVRCGGELVEYLQVTGSTSAHYWTSHDAQLLKLACAPASAGPVIAT